MQFIHASFALNRIFFSANEKATVKQNDQSDLKVFFQTNQSHCREMEDKIANALQIWLLYEFKMDLIKWQLNFGSCNFGLKSFLCDFKSNLRCALVRFWNHTYDFRPNCTPLSSITIINLPALILLRFSTLLTIYVVDSEHRSNERLLTNWRTLLFEEDCDKALNDY